MKHGNEPAWKRLFGDVQTAPVSDAWEAAKALTKHRSQNCGDALIALMLRRDAPERSEIAAYVLSWMSLRRSPVGAFLVCLSDRQQNEAVRGQAAEGIGLRFMCDRRRTRERSRAEAALIRNLDDSSATVRFWCCYALGTLRSARSIPRLEHLRDHDTAVAPGWWYVHEEATEALAWINETGTPNNKVSVHLRRADAEPELTR